MQALFSKLTKFILGAALLSAMALALAHTASAAPASMGYFVVNSTADTNAPDSVLTLREALLLAYHGTDPGYGMHKLTDAEVHQVTGCQIGGYTQNWTIEDNCGANFPETILFYLTNCPCTIAPASPLPFVSSFTTIDAYMGMTGAVVNSSPNGMNAKIMVRLYGGYLGSGVHGLNIGYNVTVKGLEIYGFNGAGSYATSGKDTIVGNVIDDNGADGIELFGTNNHIGSLALADRNSIYENGWHGIEAFSASTGNQIVNNLIGVPPDSDKGSGNTYSGVSLYSASNYLKRNTIAYNGNHGILVISGIHNNFYDNSFHDNYKQGIDLGNNGLSMNDGTARDADGGANDLQNFPVLTGAAAGTKTITGKITTNANTTIQVDLYTSPYCDAIGYGEGKTHVGSVTLTTNGKGKGTFTVQVASLKKGSAVTALASGASGTSEFSKCLVAQ